MKNVAKFFGCATIVSIVIVVIVVLVIRNVGIPGFGLEESITDTIDSQVAEQLATRTNPSQVALDTMDLDINTVLIGEGCGGFEKIWGSGGGTQVYGFDTVIQANQLSIVSCGNQIVAAQVVVESGNIDLRRIESDVTSAILFSPEEILGGLEAGINRALDEDGANVSSVQLKQGYLVLDLEPASQSARKSLPGSVLSMVQ